MCAVQLNVVYTQECLKKRVNVIYIFSKVFLLLFFFKQSVVFLSFSFFCLKKSRQSLAFITTSVLNKEQMEI